MIVYVYQDRDHSIIKVFSTLEKAKEYTKDCWGDDQEWEYCGNGEWHDEVSDYVSIYELEVE